jgi:hypothetical protein
MRASDARRGFLAWKRRPRSPRLRKKMDGRGEGNLIVELGSE